MIEKASFRPVRACALTAALFVLALIAACTSNPTPYQPASPDRGYGYSEQQLAPNRFRVIFAGNSSTPRTVVENYLLVRAAELTKMNGYSYFVLANQDVEPTTRYWSSFDHFGGYGYYYHSWPYFDRGPDYSTSYPITRYTAYADIVFVRDPKQADEAKVFSADDLLARLGPMVRRPLPQ
jgi:hypothetical protein